MFLLSLLSLIPRLLIGFFITHKIWNTLEWKYLLVKIFLAGAVGFGISSLFSFLWIWVGFNISSYVIMEFSIALFLILNVLYKNYKSISTKKIKILFQNKYGNFWGLTLIICVFVFGLFLAINSLILPHGNMDAWSNWNVVSRFIYRGGENWQNTFLRTFDHPDYPLFMPMTNAITWVYLQKDTFLGPIAFHFVLSFFMIGLLFSFINVLKTFQQAILLTIVFVSQPISTFGMSQYADFPLAYIILGIGGLTLLYLKTKFVPLTILIGFLTGLAAWTKNEGIIVLFGTTLAWFLIAFLHGWTILKKYFLGLFFPMSVVILFKIFLAPDNDVVSGAQNILTNILNIDKIMYILEKGGETFWNIGDGEISLVGILLTYILIVGKSSEVISNNWVISIIIFVQLSSYFVIYLITPHDLSWHIKTSMSRLIFHVLPLILLWIFTLTKSPEELWMKKEK